MNKKVIFNQDSWEEKVLNSNLPVMVDFWAEWCAPCHIIAPLIEKMAEEYQDKVKVGRLNVDENPNIATKYKIRGIPTLLFFKNGQVVDQVVGVTPEYVLNKKLKNLTNQ
ncbi:thioredoxin [Candidatus Aerophobetes bacterium]|nr:thioredoxin [Candidatus Aerophobetes bacterium]